MNSSNDTAMESVQALAGRKPLRQLKQAPATKHEAELRDLADANWLSRLGIRLLHFAERRIAAGSRVGDLPVFDARAFGWAQLVEQQADLIRTELAQVLERRDELPNFQDVTPGVDTINTDNSWKTWFFFGYGIRCEENCRQCPETTRILESIPGMKTAFFSILSPGKHIPAHYGPFKGVLRYHLALQVPDQAEQCRIRIHDEVHHWRDGESLIFDDTYNHEVWNDTDEQRVVLFVDFVRPCRFPGSFFNWLVLTVAAWLPALRKARKNHDQWEKTFFH